MGRDQASARTVTHADNGMYVYERHRSGASDAAISPFLGEPPNASPTTLPAYRPRAHPIFSRFAHAKPSLDPRLADEVLPEPMAEWYINTTAARQTGMLAINALQKHLGRKGLDLWDICFFVAEDGQTMFGEVSPDCLRVRAANGSALDKDIWRQGGSSETVMEKWQAFVELLTND